METLSELMIKAVFFDIDGTLFDSRKLSETARDNAVRAMIHAGLEGDKGKILASLKGIIQEKGSNYERHFDMLVEKFGMKGRADIVAAGVVAYHDTKISSLEPYSDAIVVLTKLKEKGYVLGVISNGKSVKQWEKLIRLKLGNFFDVVHISESSGKEKPDPKLFIDAMDAAKVAPENSVMVGDKPENDIAGAKAAGMLAVLMDVQGVKDKRGADITIDRLGKLPKVIKRLE
ncbi:TIGR02253 family HAD-type hydrolase [Candidatus Undinarchaeota archaeon]